MATNDETLLSKATHHPFLGYQPYAKSDAEILADATQRSASVSCLCDIVGWLDSCCCICEIGSLEEQSYCTNKFDRNGEPIYVDFKSANLRFPKNDTSYGEIRINLSDFNPRKYLKLIAFGDPLSFILRRTEFCERYATVSGDSVKLCSLVNNTTYIEAASGKQAVMAYCFHCISDFASVRPVFRLYTADDRQTSFANIIREQILRTQQLALCILIKFPNMYSKDLDESIHQKYLPQLNQMYRKVSNEIRNRGIEPVVKDEYLP